MFDYIVLAVAVIVVTAIVVFARIRKGANLGPIYFLTLLSLIIITFFATVNYINQKLAEKTPAMVPNPVKNIKIGDNSVKTIERIPIEQKVDKLSDENRKQNRSTVERFKNLQKNE